MESSDEKHDPPGPVRRKMRTGIPIFERGEDISALLSAAEAANMHPSQASGPDRKADADPVSRDRPSRQRTLNRHGLPLLDGPDNLARMFGPEPELLSRETFAELVDKSLEGKSMDALLRAKQERRLPEPVPVHKRIKRYPPPESDLDLHGFTAAAAETRAVSFLQAALRHGIFTIRIIVGRGLHSELGAILPDVVEDVLIDMKQEGVVLWFEWEKKKKSRSGSIIVYLNQFND